MLSEVKMALRISPANSTFDMEIEALIAAAKADLKLSGVSPAKVVDTTDPLIKRAVVTYVKANFGFDNPDSEKLMRSYEMLKAHLTLAGDYIAVE